MVETIRYILVVDDCEDSCDMLATLLSNAEYVVRAAADRAAALELLKFGEPDVVIMDWFMPGPSVEEFVEKARIAFPEIQIILTTAALTGDAKAKALKLGYLKKPYEPADLLHQIALAEKKRRDRK
jgi:CheY-like chemotaxis protein